MPGIYVHIPFCAQKCRYCDFYSCAGKEGHMSAYCRALMNEADRLSREGAWRGFSTVFFGGGTPSIIPHGLLTGVLEALFKFFHISEDAEITVECNPGTLTIEKLRAYREAGVNRLSIGVQSMDDALLKGIGRIHGAAQIRESFALAREAGFFNINADVMHGLPGQTEMDYLCTLCDVTALNPTHISAYRLILEEGTPLFEDVNGGVVILPDEEETSIMQDVGIAFLEASGFGRYEISNFSKPGLECRHNINYWENGEYLGLGAGAHSAWRTGGEWTRSNNISDIEEYINNPASPARSVIPRDEEAFESVMLGLRMIKGVSLDTFYERFQRRFEEMYVGAIAQLTKKGWLTIENGRARLTDKGLDMQNAALLEFME